MYFQRHHFETILILSLYIYHFSTMIDFSSEKYSGSTGHRNSWYQQRNLQQQLLSCITQWLEHWVCNPGVASSSLTIGILTVNFSTGTRSFCVQQNHCTSRMRSQSQLTNDKYIMMQYTNWINSTHSQQQLLSCIAQWLEHWVCNPGVASSSLTIGNFNFFQHVCHMEHQISKCSKCPYLPNIQFWLALLGLQCPVNLLVSPSTDLLVAISAVSGLGVPANQSATLFSFQK